MHQLQRLVSGHLAQHVAKAADVEQADRRAAAEGGIRAGDGVGDTDHARGDRMPVHDEPAAPILDLGDHVDVTGRLGVTPVGGQGVAAHDALPDVDVSSPAHHRILGTGEDDDRPRARLGRERGHRDRVVVDDRRREQRRQRSVGAAIVAAEVHVPALGTPLIGTAYPCGLEQVGQGRPAPSGVDDEVGVDALSRVGHHARDVRNVAAVLDHEATHGGASTDLHAGLGVGGTGERGLDERAAAAHRVEALVAGPEPARHRLRQRQQPVEAQAASVDQGLVDVGQLRFEQPREPWQEAVREAELVDTAPLPVAPRLGWRRWRWRRVTLEHRHPVPVPGEEEGAGQPGQRSSDDDDVGQSRTLLRRAIPTEHDRGRQVMEIR